MTLQDNDRTIRTLVAFPSVIGLALGATRSRFAEGSTTRVRVNSPGDENDTGSARASASASEGHVAFFGDTGNPAPGGKPTYDPRRAETAGMFGTFSPATGGEQFRLEQGMGVGVRV